MTTTEPERATEQYAGHLGWGPLRDVRIVEFGHFVAAPYSTLQLAYYGAEVIKIESLGRPDMWRLREGNADLNGSVTFGDHNKNKLSVTLDMKDAACRAVVADLIAKSDIVVENFSFGVLERMGFGYEALKAIKPDLIMVGLQGFGRSGAMRDAVALGPSLMAFSGMTQLWSEPGGDPVGSQTSYPDYIVGIQAAFTMMCALEHRDRTGEGQYIEFAQIDAVYALIAPEMADAAARLEGQPAATSTRSASPSGVYQCAGEERWCLIEVDTEDRWQALAGAIPALAEHAGLDAGEREARRAELSGIVGAWAAERSADDAMHHLQRHGVPAGAVLDGRDLNENEHLAARGFAVATGHPVLGDVLLPTPGAHHHVAGEAGEAGPRVSRYAPMLGGDRDDVLGRVLGLSQEEIDGLKA